jgi:hypothetical protein
VPGYDDPRYLQQVIEAQDRRIRRLEDQIKQTPRYGVSPAPPIAVLWNENLQNPQITISDGSARARFAVGNLSAYTGPNGVASPALFGYRSLDATGNVIGDSAGLSQIMAELGHVEATGGPVNFTSTTPALVSIGGVGATITFTLTRQVRVLALASILGFAVGDVGLVDIFVDGVNKCPTKGPHIAFGPGVNGVTTAVSYYSESLATGSHTIQLRGYVQTSGGTQTLSVDTHDLICWQLGA